MNVEYKSTGEETGIRDIKGQMIHDGDVLVAGESVYESVYDVMYFLGCYFAVDRTWNFKSFDEMVEYFENEFMDCLPLLYIMAPTLKLKNK